MSNERRPRAVAASDEGDRDEFYGPCRTELEKAGVEGVLDIWEDMIHTWQLFAAFVPEGQAAVDKIGQFIDGRLG